MRLYQNFSNLLQLENGSKNEKNLPYFDNYDDYFCSGGILPRLVG